MKDGKRELKRTDRLRTVLVAALAILAVFACMGSAVCLVLAFVLLLPMAAVEIVLNRCPCCGGWLGRNRGKYCQHCGGQIR